MKVAIALDKNKFLLVAVLIFLQGCMSYKPVTLETIESVNFKGISQGTASVNVVVRIKNPNNYKIKIKKYDLHTFLDEKDMGPVNISDTSSFPKSQTKVIH